MNTTATRQQLLERGFIAQGNNSLSKLLSKQRKDSAFGWVSTPRLNEDYSLHLEVFITDKDEIFSIHLKVNPNSIYFKLNDNPTIEDIDNLIKILEHGTYNY